MNVQELYDVMDGTLYGRGDTRQEAVLDAMRNAYFGKNLITSDQIAEELAKSKATGGALGFDFREVAQ